MTRVQFWKYHGAGNDFLLVDLRGRPEGLSPDAVRRICARSTGVGADGILGLVPSPAGPHMRVMNSDGSIGDMCGNGLRCFVAWLIETQGYPCAPMVIGSDSGPQPAIPERTARGITSVTVQLNRPAFEPETTVEIQGRAFRGVPASVGNPHFVMVRSPNPAELAAFGLALATHPRFPRGANIEWLEPTGERSGRLTVWERGCGLTQACGTGGGAAAAVGVQLGLFARGVPIELELPGGTLTYTVTDERLVMRGPVEYICSGRLAAVRLSPWQPGDES